jgi:prophage antirepressor-like protein
MQNLMIFEGHDVEVFEFNGQVLFNPYHVGACLELGNSAVKMAVAKMNEKQAIKLTNSKVNKVDFRKLNNTGENFLTESGVYKLVFKSHKPNAEAFTDWIADKVLPSIRKTGAYGTPKSPLELLELHYAAIKQVNDKVDKVEKDLADFKLEMPLLGVEENQITRAVRKKGMQLLGGESSNSYRDHSLRSKVYQDIYRELKHQFGVSTYKAIRRSQCELALQFINEYEPPFILAEQIKNCNAQFTMEV